MKRPWLWIIIVANLIGFIVLTFVYPSTMVSPGTLVPAHAELAGNCFICHAPFRGIASDRCVRCHAMADIGVRTASGAPLKRLNKRGINASFHQELSEQNCSSCHSDHGRPITLQFSHALLRPAARGACATCHAAPTDSLHSQLTKACAQCHAPPRWTPSTFNHDRFFLLDRDHNVTCATCHTNSDFARYTCFGCHEHTQANIRAKHEDEASGSLDNCVSCHRSADGESGEHGEGRKHGEGREHGEDREHSRGREDDEH